MEKLTLPQGAFQLARYPRRKKETLRAWDAADEYLLQHLHENRLPDARASVWILNDSFGALSLALANHRPSMSSDSYLAHRGTLENLQNNNLSATDVRLSSSLQSPKGSFDLVLVKIPRNLALLEDQLHRIRPYLHSATRVIGAGMVKAIHTSTLDLWDRLIGPTRTSLAKKKARLIFSQPDVEKKIDASPYPGQYTLEGTAYRITNHANVFSRERLDIGTRFFLDQIPRSANFQNIVDLGCGNGVVGLVAAERNPEAELIFVDESFMAIASAEINFHDAFGDRRKAQFQVTDCLSGIPANSADLVLNNPPFHQQGAVGDATAWQMFGESRDVLVQGGELWIVGNRHLAYHAKLKRLFGNCRVIASNRKFVVLKATK
ncbi:MAG: methyltransferase [Gemmatimonadetes bacterium]|jgi:23S rRNA (guanine1835-N2)-methyltransferase|nr:methyltransferase [Gemmatimonadota bacterium]